MSNPQQPRRRVSAIRPSHQQRGAVLVVALVILVVLTSMGLSGMRTANLEEHFAGNLRDQNLAFEAAESALRFAEDWLESQGSTKPASVSSCGSPPCDVFKAHALENGFFADKNKAWWAVNGRTTYTVAADYLDHVSNQPRFIVEESTFAPEGPDMSGAPSGHQYYRITAFGQGGSEFTHVILQSTYAKKFN